MASSSYSDFEQEYNDHLSKVRSFLAAPTDNALAAANNNNRAGPSIRSCESALRDAKQCIASMQGLAEIEGDPFKAREAGRKLERDIGPLEGELKGRRKGNGNANGGGGGGIGAAFGRSGGNSSTHGNDGGRRRNGDDNYLFGNRTGANNAYAAPSLGGDDDLESGRGSSFTARLTEMEQRMQDSEHLLRETQALCADSEQIGASTLETMGGQREQMERSSGLIRQSLEDTQQARAIMKEMARRALKNKIFLYCIIVLLVLANGAAIVHQWRRKK